MRVLMVSDVFLPRINGVSSSIKTFRKVLSRQGVEVSLIVPRYGDEDHEEGVLRVPGRRIPFDPEDRLTNWRILRRSVSEAAANADLIHVQTPFSAHYAGLKAARERNIPIICTYHTLFEEYFEGYLPFLPKTWLRACARGFSKRQCNDMHAVVSPSEAMSKRLLEYGVTAAIHEIPTGVDVQRFTGGKGDAFRQRYGIDPQRPVALFVGRVAPEKNIGFLLRALKIALKKIPNLLLVIAGDGPAMQAVKADIAALELTQSVLLTGYLDGENEIPDCYAAANLFAFASLTETQGLVLPEAMSTGLPVVSLSSMGTIDILAARRGCLVPENNHQSFADALVQLLTDTQLHSRLKEEAQIHANCWSDVLLGERLADLYKSLIQQR